MTLRLIITTVALLLAGCDIPGMGADPRITQREADAKAIGGACRHGLRSIEDCYSLNEKASKADMFTGWKDMDQYMRENKIEGVSATIAKTAPKEEIIEDDMPKADHKDKASTETKEKSAEVKTKAAEKIGAKSPAKSADKAAAH